MRASRSQACMRARLQARGEAHLKKKVPKPNPYADVGIESILELTGVESERNNLLSIIVTNTAVGSINGKLLQIRVTTVYVSHQVLDLDCARN